MEQPDEQDDPTKKKVSPRPFLKRKTKAVVVKAVPKEEKPQGKSRIDCWHRDKDTNVLIYGNREPKSRKSLMKSKQAKSASKVNRMNEESTGQQYGMRG